MRLRALPVTGARLYEQNGPLTLGLRPLANAQNRCGAQAGVNRV